MADAEQRPDGQSGSEEQHDKPKSYSEEQFKELVGQRDALKTRLRALEDDAKKRIEADEEAKKQKAIEEGKLKDILTETEAKLKTLSEKAEAYEKQQEKLRKSLISKISDKDLKAIAEDIGDLDKLQLFVDKHTKDLTGPDATRGAPPDLQTVLSKIPQFKGSPSELVKALQEAGLNVR